MQLFIKGFIIGLGKVIPGVSGAMLAISLNVYEQAITSISTFYKNPTKNIKFLIPLGLGVITAIITTSKIIIELINNFYLPTMLLFIGLIFGGTPSVCKKITKLNFKTYLIFIISFLTIIFLARETSISQNQNNNILIILLLGFIDAITMIIPGLSGTAILLITGLYNTYLNLISNININIVPFIISLSINIVLISSMLNYLFKKYSNEIYTSAFSFSLASILLLMLNTIEKATISSLLLNSIFFIVGIIISLKLDSK